MLELAELIFIDSNSELPAYRQLYISLRSLIESGAIPSGFRLPPIRTLASSLGIARNTVDTAYRQLKVEGYVRSRQGSGFVVEDLDFSVLSTDDKDECASTERSISTNPLGDDYGCKYDFSYGNRSDDGFPIGIWKSMAAGILSSPTSRGANTYSDQLGLYSLREQLAKWLSETRGCHCTPEQIVIQPGTQPALRNIVLLFGGSRRSVAFEEPGYDGARLALQSQGCTIIPIPVHKGYDFYLENLRKSRAKLAFVTPSSQFPLGCPMPMNARLQLIDWAVKRDSYIFEDDYCCECRYDGVKALPSLQSLDTHDRVIYMGTTSKILSPALRLSYIVLPPELLAKWREVFSRDFCSTSWFIQEGMARFLASDQWHPYVHRTVNMYQNRHDMLIDCLDREFGDSIDIIGREAGLHLLVGTKDGRSAATLIEQARKNDVRVYETEGYWHSADHPMKDYVLVGFSSIETEQIPAGVRALKDAWLS